MSPAIALVKPSFFTLIAFTLCVLFPTYSQANTTSNQEAQRLKASFQRLLDYQKGVNDIIGSLDITYDGDLTVVRQPDYYTLTFPHIFLSGEAYNAEEQKPSKQVFDLGVITINAMADENPEYWKIILTLPEKFALYDALKKSGDPDLFSLNIGEQRTIALYSEKLGYFTKMDMNLSGLAFMVGGKKIDMELGGVQFYTKLEEQDNGKFSGPGHFLLNNLHVSPKDQDDKVDIEELKFGFNMNDWALPTLEDYQQKLLKHKDTFSNLQTLENQTGMEVSGQKVFEMFSDMYDFDMGGFSFSYSTKNVNILDTPNADMEGNIPDAKTMHITAGRFGVGASELKTDKGALFVGLDYKGFKTTPVDPELDDLVPQNLNLKIEAQNIPFTTLGALATNTIQGIAKNPKSAQMAGLGVLMRLPAIVSQAGTQVAINENNISNHIYDVTLNGKVTTDMSSMLGFSAKFNLLFEGLDTLLSASEKHSANEDSKNMNEYKQLVPKLNKLKTVGKQTTNKNNKPAYSYDIELGQQGNLTINGQDIKTIFGEQPQ